MGTSLSTGVDLTKNDYLIKFVSKEQISSNDPFWNRFLAFNVEAPTTRYQQYQLNTRIEPLCKLFLTNNKESNNLNALVHVFLSRAAELLLASNTDDSIFCWQIYNALFTIRCVFKYLTEMLNEEEINEHIESNKDNGINLESLLGTLMGIIVDVPLKNLTYHIHLEAVKILIVLLSVYVHNNYKVDQSIIHKLMMKGRHSIHAPLLVKSLLNNFIEQQKAPNGFGVNQGHSIVIGIATELWSILTFQKKDKNNLNAPELNDEVPLASHSLLLALILANHCANEQNPYRQTIFSCANGQDNNPLPPSNASSIIKIDYDALYNTICKKAHIDSTTLLLYLLLHRNTLFKNYVLRRQDLDKLVVPILKTLYHAPNSNSHNIYMSLIILLILSEDDYFNRCIHEVKLKPVPWYTERALSDLSLGGLIILVLIRTIQYNMLKLRDKYLHTNCLAALANMSAQFRDLHPYISQRLVSLFEMLAKKFLKIKNQNGDLKIQINEEGNMEQDIAIIEEVLRMVLEIFNSCLSNQLVNNPNLVYTLLYKKQVFEPFKNHLAFQDVVHNIEFVIEYFSGLLKLDTDRSDVEPTQVLSIIKQGARSWPKEKLTKFPDLKFKYVEEDQPEEFFIPYVWSLVYEQTTLQLYVDKNLTQVC